MTPPRVTVLMAVHDDERFVADAMRSILGQSFTDFEFVIVDDGSADRSREIVGSFGDRRIHVVDQADPVGLTKSLNRGLARSRSRRLRMVPMVTRVLGANIRRLTRQASLPDGWPEIWVRLIYSDPQLRSEEAMRALDLLAATRARFADACPESRDSREIADQVALGCEQAAFDLCRTDRRAALRVFARAVASSARHAARDLPRFGTRLLFGDAPVRLWRQLAHR